MWVASVPNGCFIHSYLGVSENSGYLFGGPQNKSSILGLYGGPLILENYHLFHTSACPYLMIVDAAPLTQAQMETETELAPYSVLQALNPNGHLQHMGTIRIQVPGNYILTQNLYYDYYYPNPKKLILGDMDPLGNTHCAQKDYDPDCQATLFPTDQF